jgi:FG-GAP-like repeat
MKTKITLSGSRIAFLLSSLFVIASLLSPEALSAGCHINFRFSHLGKMTIQESTYETAVADFDGDGHLDVAVPLVSAGIIQIYRGNGNGAFAAPMTYSAPGFVQSIAAGDFNGDGKPDLAAAVIYGVGVRVFLNDGSGGFGTSTLYPAGSYPSQVVVADFNGDGNLDLTVPDYNAGTNQVLLGDGHGNFGAPISSPTGGGEVVAGDFNSDGKMDLAEGTNDLKILLGDGTGRFTVGNSYSFGPGNPTNLATADFNHDGTLDLAIGVINADAQVYTFLGNGMGAFSSSAPVGQSDAQGVAAVDLDGDGKVDLVTADYSNESVSFARGNGRGGFAAIRSYPLPSKPKIPLPYRITTGDFNEDGLPDVVTADYGAAGATVALTICR